MTKVPSAASRQQVADMDDQGIALLALNQLHTYVVLMDRMPGRHRKAVRDALANAVADLHAQGVTR